MPLLAIAESRVQCPWSGSVDVDVCLSCPRLRSLRRSDDGTFVSCADRTDLMESFLIYGDAPDRLARIFRSRRT
jgi:hypothetical protein